MRRFFDIMSLLGSGRDEGDPKKDSVEVIETPTISGGGNRMPALSGRRPNESMSAYLNRTNQTYPLMSNRQILTTLLQRSKAQATPPPMESDRPRSNLRGY